MQDDLGRLIVRLSTGGLVLLHGVHKLLTGIEPIKSMVTAHQMPELLSYGVYLGEIVGPILVILGVFSRIGGMLIAFNMVVAVLLAGMGEVLMLNAHGGYALELETLYLFGGIAIAVLGSGRFGLGLGGRWN